MTRKCVLCKATNYKRTYSFFSAPKDPEIRKKWQAILPMSNYTVTDDTYICSKHFRSSDIITHWVSGVPPNVITIKYKKFRLRVGAVPCLNFENNDNAPETIVADHIGRCSKLLGNESDSLIPREHYAKSVATASQITEACFNHPNGTFKLPIKVKKYNGASDQSNKHFNRIEYVDVDNSYKSYASSDEQIQDSVNSEEDKVFNQLKNCFDYQYPQIDKVEGSTSLIGEKLHKNLENEDHEAFQDAKIHCGLYSKVTETSHHVKLEQDVQVLTDELMIEEDDLTTLHSGHMGNNDEPNHQDTSGGNHEIIRPNELGDNLLEASQYDIENKVGEENPESGLCDTMLFEDLLEIYTEVRLPRGWAFLVTSKGQTTTVVYLYMNTPTNHIPVIEKEVYIKSDMVIHCGVGSREINPFLYDLMSDGKNNKVHALSDIEEVIDELDQRHICEGGPNAQNVTGVEIRFAYVDGTKWRHSACPIIINNGSSKCSKCLSLNSRAARRRLRTMKGLSLEILKDQRKEIELLKKSLKKMTRQNQRLEGIRLRFKNRLRLLLVDSEKTMKKKISLSNMPEIQKLMIKECLKASVFKNKNNVGHCETWIFLCLLLYVESPRMYRYMIVNNYMALPSIGIIRKYLNQIKIDPQFYNLFQRSVEPYQPVNEQDEQELT